MSTTRVTSNEEPDTDGPPLTKVSRGRPKKKRMRKDEAHRQRTKRATDANGRDSVPDRAPRRCGICGGTDGHNARSCTRPHV
jgi:hypothetical protein